jgi:hypothetical protein
MRFEIQFGIVVRLLESKTMTGPPHAVYYEIRGVKD